MADKPSVQGSSTAADQESHKSTAQNDNAGTAAEASQPSTTGDIHGDNDASKNILSALAPTFLPVPATYSYFEPTYSHDTLPYTDPYPLLYDNGTGLYTVAPSYDAMLHVPPGEMFPDYMQRFLPMMHSPNDYGTGPPRLSKKARKKLLQKQREMAAAMDQAGDATVAPTTEAHKPNKQNHKQGQVAPKTQPPSTESDPNSASPDATKNPGDSPPKKTRHRGARKTASQRRSEQAASEATQAGLSAKASEDITPAALSYGDALKQSNRASVPVPDTGSLPDTALLPSTTAKKSGGQPTGAGSHRNVESTKTQPASEDKNSPITAGTAATTSGSELPRNATRGGLLQVSGATRAQAMRGMTKAASASNTPAAAPAAPSNVKMVWGKPVLIPSANERGPQRDAAESVSAKPVQGASGGGKKGKGKQSHAPMLLGDLLFQQLRAAESKKKPTNTAPGSKVRGTTLSLGTGIQQGVSPRVRPGSQPGRRGKASAASSGPVSRNILDSSAPARVRGKERETPKRKNPTLLKRVIITERTVLKEVRSAQRRAQDTTASLVAATKQLERNRELVTAMIAVLTGAADVVPLALDSEDMDDDEPPEEKLKRLKLMKRFPQVKWAAHSRKFREYCNHCIDPELNRLAVQFLEKLVQFQNRMHERDPIKARAKRRFVLGLREVGKSVARGKIRCVLVAPDIERIEAEGGLDDILARIINQCHEQSVPVMFCLRRRKLGRTLCKPVAVSIVGIRDYQGAQDIFHSMMERSAIAASEYERKVQQGNSAADATPSSS
eukprot:m.400231 g.400231  ORF g.400231 m.400231 type:complete len:783 (+) comp21158_c0_seq4:448-2796(+)